MKILPLFLGCHLKIGQPHGDGFQGAAHRGDIGVTHGLRPVQPCIMAQKAVKPGVRIILGKAVERRCGGFDLVHRHAAVLFLQNAVGAAFHRYGYAADLTGQGQEYLGAVMLSTLLLQPPVQRAALRHAVPAAGRAAVDVPAAQQEFHQLPHRDGHTLRHRAIPPQDKMKTEQMFIL